MPLTLKTTQMMSFLLLSPQTRNMWTSGQLQHEWGFVKNSFLAFSFLSLNDVKCNKTKFWCSNFFNTLCIFLFMGGGGLPKNYSDEGGGGMRKKSEIRGGSYNFQITLLQIPPAPPPLPIKNERSLNYWPLSGGWTVLSHRKSTSSVMIYRY